MSQYIRKISSIVGISALLLGLFVVGAQAQVTSCSTAISPTVLDPGSQSQLAVRVVNLSGPDVVWVEVMRPNADYVVNGAGLDGWQASVRNDRVVFTGGSFGGDGRVDSTLTVTAQAWQSDPANWIVRVSDDPYGANAHECSGTSRSTSIQRYLPDGAAGLGISQVSVVPAGRSAVVRWQSDQPAASGVVYGASSDYGSSSVYSPQMVTSHAVTITVLSPETGYHFQVGGRGADGIPYYSDDNTFVTLDAATIITIAGGTPSAGGTRIVKESSAGSKASGDITPPTITVGTKLSGVYRDGPVMSGTAGDNLAVAGVDFSIDGGKNWAAAAVKPVPKDIHTVTFSFQPVVPEDGNYMVLARARDAAGNQAVSPVMQLVIDRLPPRMGGAVVSVGAQVLMPNDGGAWPAVVDTDQQITLKAVGGPTSVVVDATKASGTTVSQRFNLRHDDDTGLWSGIVSFTAAGAYGLNVVAVDGAGNRVQSALPSMSVVSAAFVKGRGGAKVSSAQATMLYRRPGGEWTVWDGSAFGQTNPQSTRKDGSFHLFAPAGTFYMKVTAPGYKTLVTQQFVLTKPTPIVADLELEPAMVLGTGGWKWQVPGVSYGKQIKSPDGDKVAPVATASLVGKTFPQFSLPMTAGTASSVGLLGRPSVVTVLTPWAPGMSEQLQQLSKLRDQANVNMVPLVLCERLSLVRAYVARGAYSVPVAVDETGTLSDGLGVSALPKHYLLDRTGIVRQVVSGLMSEAQLKSALAGL